MKLELNAKLNLYPNVPISRIDEVKKSVENILSTTEKKFVTRNWLISILQQDGVETVILNKPTKTFGMQQIGLVKFDPIIITFGKYSQ